MKNAFPLLFLFLPTLVWAQRVDSIAIRQVDSLIQISRTLTGQRDFDQALEVNSAAEKIALEKLGRKSAAFGSCCFNHGRVLHIKGDIPEAEKWYLDSKTIREKALGKEHPDYAWSLSNLAFLYKDMGRYEKAESLLLEALTIREKALGKEHPEYVASLHILGRLYSDTGLYEKAEPLYLEAKAIREKVLGKEHPEYAATLNTLAILYSNMGQYEKVEPLYLEAKAIREKVLGKTHPDYAASLVNLGILYYFMGLYEKAEPLYLEAKEIFENRLNDQNHSFYFNCLGNLGILYKTMGQYEKAEPLLLEAIAIREKVFGKEHPEYAASLSNLAILYTVMGQYEKAELLELEAIAIREKALGKEHPEFAMSLGNLAHLYTVMGQYEKAEPLYLQSKAIREKVLGKEHPEYAQSLNNLANLCLELGQYEKAELLELEAIAIREKALGKAHPEYASSLNDLANLYLESGPYEKAEPLYLEAKAIWEKALGKEHPHYAATIYNLAGLYGNMGKYEKAEPLYLELLVVNKRLIEKAMHHLSEQELNNYMDKFSQDQNQVLAFTQRTKCKKLNAACYDNSLFYKGFLLQAAGRIKQLAVMDTAATEKYNRLKGYQRRLAAQYAQPIAEQDSALVAQLETRANDIEKDLVRTVAGYSEAKRQVQWQEVQASLQSGEAAVEFVHYRYYDKKATDSTMYAALVLRPGNAGPAFIPLFEERSLDSLLSLHGERNGDYVNRLYSMAERGLTPLGQPQKSLYEFIWQPLEKELAGIQTVYFSPSGLLHRLNLEAIPVSDEETLTDRYNMVGMNSTRQLVVPVNVAVAEQSAILFGGIQYEMDSTAIAAANKDYGTDLLATRGGLPFSYTDSTLRFAYRSFREGRGGAWSYLKWTEKEVDKIATMLATVGIKTNTRKGYTATEESFKAIGRTGPSPRILHLATHGYFFADPQKRDKELRMEENELVFKISEHPMIRSGLLLAGGNFAWQTGKPIQPDMEDGIITAYEISQMNLSNTELVVLSACETGLGDIQGNEGVYGLQRAFKIAGAKYLIMSLWQVPDQETSVFMTTFYSHWITDNQSIPEAFRNTQQEMRERFINPYQWAGFVLLE